MFRRNQFVSDLRVVLQGANFRKLFAVRLVSQASDGAFQVGLASLVFFSPDRATTTQAAAVAAVVTVLPYTVIGPFAGVLLDVWPRRQVLLVANAVRAAMVLGVAGLVLAGVVGPLLYVSALACLSVNRFFLAGLGAALPAVVPGDELVMANAVSPTCGTVAALLGAGVGFVAGRVFGAGDGVDALVLAVSAVGYAASALLALRMSRGLLGPEERAPLSWRSVGAAGADVLRDLAAGARHVRERRRAGYALGMIGAHRVGYGVVTISALLLCRNHFTDPADADAGLALLAKIVGATGAGVGLSALATPPAVRRLGKTGWIVTALLVSAAVEVSFLVRLSVPALFVGAFLIGLAGQGAKICVDAIVQESVDDGYRGRVFSFYDVVFNAAFVSAAGISVLVLPADGWSAPVTAGIALDFALCAAIYLGLVRALRRRAPEPLPQLVTR